MQRTHIPNLDKKRSASGRIDSKNREYDKSKKSNIRQMACRGGVEMLLQALFKIFLGLSLLWLITVIIFWTLKFIFAAVIDTINYWRSKNYHYNQMKIFSNEVKERLLKRELKARNK